MLGNLAERGYFRALRERASWRKVLGEPGKGIIRCLWLTKGTERGECQIPAPTLKALWKAIVAEW